MKPVRKLIAISISVIGLSLSSGAMAASFAYMSENGSEPWGVNSNVDAMNAAFGAGNWDRISFGDSISGYSFVYADGGDNAGTNFYNYVSTNQSALESYVTSGGRLFLNAASNGNGGSPYGLIFGASTEEGGINGYSAYGYAVNPGDPLFAGAGTQWQGSWFAHNVVTTGTGFSALITGDAGQTVLAGGAFGSGYAMLGGQTSTYFHWGVNGSDPFQLRVNELRYAADFAAPVPEPETYAMMLAGLGMLGFMARRRKRMAA